MCQRSRPLQIFVCQIEVYLKTIRHILQLVCLYQAFCANQDVFDHASFWGSVSIQKLLFPLTWSSRGNDSVGGARSAVGCGHRSRAVTCLGVQG